MPSSETAEKPREALTARELALRARVIDLAALLIVTDCESLVKIAAYFEREAAGSQVFTVADEIIHAAIDIGMRAKADDRTAKMRQALLDIANCVTDNPAATARGALESLVS
jgi:hypothetical protein